MSRSKLLLPGILLSVVMSGLSSFSAAPAKAPELNEVLAILQTNRPAGMTETELNAAAVRGLLSALGGKAAIVNPDGEEPASKKFISKAEVFDATIAYLRIDRVAGELPDAISERLKAFSKTNKLQGVVLDLRFASGTDYEASVATANLFIPKARPLLNWGDGMKSSTGGNTNATVPIAVLVNEQTSAAAEALAAVLRDTGAALILGGKTAGATAAPKDFKLSNGQVLRIGVRPIELGSGSKLSGAVRPDIEIQVNAEEERVYYADSFAVVAKTNQGTEIQGANGTNRVSRRTRFNEADLVREHSRSRGEDLAPGEKRPDAPVVSDPVLARAIDVLKGLAVVRQARN